MTKLSFFNILKNVAVIAQPSNFFVACGVSL